MKGKLFIIEGLDSSGKETQTKKLYERLKKENINVRKVEYPNYKSASSSLVKMYLNGDFGKNPNDVNAYIASTFYAVDRYASYKTEWEEFYKSGGIILADRYTTSNMIHQASKIEDKDEQQKFLNWLQEFEFGMYQLPKPDCVIFINMPPEYSKELMAKRDNKITGMAQKDIHERDYEYLTKSYNNAMEIVKQFGWSIINCVESDNLRTIDDIHESIYTEIVKKIQ